MCVSWILIENLRINQANVMCCVMAVKSPHALFEV